MMKDAIDCWRRSSLLLFDAFEVTFVSGSGGTSSSSCMGDESLDSSSKESVLNPHVLDIGKLEQSVETTIVDNE